MIRITATITIPEDALSERFIRASGPGGQNVNKVATAVELRCDLNRADLPIDMRQRLSILAGRQLNLDNVLVITADTHRSQERNRAEALAPPHVPAQAGRDQAEETHRHQADQGVAPAPPRCQVTQIQDQGPAPRPSHFRLRRALPVHITMAPDEWKTFAGFVRCAARYVEFGAGASTVLAAASVKDWVVAFDSSQGWLARVAEACRDRGHEDCTDALLHRHRRDRRLGLPQGRDVARPLAALSFEHVGRWTSCRGRSLSGRREFPPRLFRASAAPLQRPCLHRLP